MMSMTRRTWLGLLASVAAVTVAITPAIAQQPKKPNIVFMLTDNLGYGELGVYGGGILRGAPTPSIDALAAKACACSTSTSRRNAHPPDPRS